LPLAVAKTVTVGLVAIDTPLAFLMLASSAWATGILVALPIVISP
jgi:hypothetical protein